MPNFLGNADAVIAAFGYWPIFHDAPVLRWEVGDDCIELDLETWEMTSETDERGSIILTKKHQIGFRFTGITHPYLDDFTADNILFSLQFVQTQPASSESSFTVELDSAMGCDRDGRFTAQHGEVTFVRPCS